MNSLTNFFAAGGHYVAGLAGIGSISGLMAVGAITGPSGLYVITGIVSALIGGGLATPNTTTVNPPAVPQIQSQIPPHV